MDQLVTAELNQITAEIRFFTTQTAVGMIEAGRRLIRAKELVPHGEWLEWLEANTGIKDRTARNFMRAAREFGNRQTYADLAASKVVALFGLPEDDREDFVETSHLLPSGETKTPNDMTTRELQETIRREKEAKQRAEKAERERDEAIEQAVSLDERANAILEENKRLKREKSQEPQTVEKVVHAIPDETKRELELLKENARKWREEAQNAQTKAAQAETEVQQYRETLGELSDAQLRKNQRHAVIDRIKWFRGEVGQRLKQLDVEAQELRTDIEVRREVENCALALNRAASEMREWLEEIHPKEVVYDAGTFASG